MAKKKLLLILPHNKNSFLGGISKSGKSGFIRLGLPTIAALTPEDWEVEILDTRVKDIDYDAKVDLVGITSFTPEAMHAYEIGDGFKKRGTKVIMGGVHVSAVPEEALKHADSILIGEAELVWETVLEDLENNDLKATYKSDTMPEMGGWPLPRRDLMDRAMYTSGFNTIQATRGCPFDCGYCSVTAFFGAKFRTRPIAEVIAEIKNFDTKHFFFLDDNIAGIPKYAKELFHELAPLKKTWGSQAAITISKDSELLSLYHKSGGRYALIGFESLSEAALKRLNKSWNSPDGYPESIRRIQEAGINITASFVLGLDEDDKSVFKNTFEFIMDNKITSAMFNILTPLPGTRLYEELNKEGRITCRDWGKYNFSEVVYEPKGMTAKELQDGLHWLYRKTYSTKNILKRCFSFSPDKLFYRLAVNVSYRNKARKMPFPENFYSKG
jgi:radical SAM superfamily enzyme YgiQ (UPF0313 family)